MKEYFIKRENKVIEPEEILLDRMSSEKLDNSKLELKIPKKNFYVFFGVIVVVFLVFFGRVFYLQVFKHDAYAALTENNKTRSYPVIAQRGVMYDRNFNQLVFNVPSFDLVAIPANMPKERSEREEELVRVADEFGIDRIDLLNSFKNVNLLSFSPILIKENIERERALFMETKIGDFPGLELKKNSVRDYKNGEYFANILGYTGKVSERDLLENKDLSSLDHIGKSGIESFYDKVLRGQNGRMIQYVDSVLRLKKERKVQDEVTGKNLVLSIDEGLQKKIYDELKKQIDLIEEAEGAAAVAIDPNTGEILALVSLPSYNNNIFSSEELREQYKYLAGNPLKPLFNRPISGVYPPGSAIKPFMASAALEDGVITKNTRINDIGYISIQNVYDPEIFYTFRDWKAGGHGIISVRDAIAVSSNVFFYTLGGGHGDIDGLGIKKMKEYLDLFGFGQITNIDIFGEEAGLIPDAEWKKNVKGEDWYVGDTYNSAIGQGNTLVTPIQLALATASVANGGKLLEPYIVKSIYEEGVEENSYSSVRLVRDDFIGPENLKVVREGMRMAVTEGSAIRLRDLPVEIAGKTGTAQIGGGDDTHAWFTSFAPYKDPEIVLTIIIEKGGEGSAAAVPVAKEVYKYYFDIKDPEPKAEETAINNDPINESEVSL